MHAPPLPDRSKTRVAVVTGASSGIGAACAAALGEHGWTVVGMSRRTPASAATATAVGCEFISVDVDDDRATSEAFAATIERHGRIDALVAAAGWGLAGPVEGTAIADAKAQFETNFWGVVRAATAVLPTMRAQRSGRIVVIGSIGGLIGLPFQAYYSATKFALEGWAEALAYEVAPFGIGVTVVEPGNIATGFTAARRDTSAADDGAYAVAAAKAIAAMARDEASGAAPEAVAAAVVRTVTARRAPRRVAVGSAGERSAVVLRRLLPSRAFERVVSSTLLGG